MLVKVAICDDDLSVLGLVGTSVRQILEARGYDNPEIETFSCETVLREAIGAGHAYDIMFLDIILPDGDGIELARWIKSKHHGTQVIFLTISADYAVKAFSVEATHYLVKPVSRLDLEEAVDRALRTFSPVQTLQLPLHSENGSVVKINIDDILYIESVGYRRMIHTRTTVYEEKRTTLSRLMEDLERLSPGKFILPYRGYIVNLDAIKTVSTNRIVLENDDFVLIKRGDFRKIRDLFLERVFPQE